MTDYLHELLKMLDHDRYAILLPVMVLVLGALVLVPALSCAGPKTFSIKDPGKKVTSAELNREVIEEKARLDLEKAGIEKARTNCSTDYTAKVESYNVQVQALNEKAEVAQAVIVAKQEQAMVVLETIDTAVKTYVPAPFAAPISLVLGLAGAAFGIGKRGDTARKDAVIQQLQVENEKLKTEAGAPTV